MTVSVMTISVMTISVMTISGDAPLSGRNLDGVGEMQLVLKSPGGDRSTSVMTTHVMTISVMTISVMAISVMTFSADKALSETG